MERLNQKINPQNFASLIRYKISSEDNFSKFSNLLTTLPLKIQTFAVQTETLNVHNLALLWEDLKNWPMCHTHEIYCLFEWRFLYLN